MYETEASGFGSQVLELQDCVSTLQDQLSQAQESDLSAREGKDKDAAARRPWKQVRSHNSCKLNRAFSLSSQCLFLQLNLIHLQGFFILFHIFQILDESCLSHCLTSTFTSSFLTCRTCILTLLLCLACY